MGQEGYGTGGAYNAIDDDGSSLAESIVQYAERATTAEGKVAELESHLAALEMGSQQPPPQIGYYAPHTAYSMMPGAPPPLTTINVPPTYHHQQPQTWGGKRNYNDNNRGGQRRRPNNYRGNRNGGGGRGDRRNANNTQKAYSNSLKQNVSLLYYFSCGYDVDHGGYNCRPNCQKQVHLPHVKRDDTHMYEGACVKAQHKTMPDGTGAGQGWIMTKNMEKGRFVLEKQATWKAQQKGGQHKWQPQQQQQWQPQQQWKQPTQQQPYQPQQQANIAYQMAQAPQPQQQQ